MKLRAGQREFLRRISDHRIAALLTRRQFGKTSLAAFIALMKMMKQPGHTVVFGSVKIDLGREIVRKEAEAIQRALQDFSAEKHLLTIADAQSGKELDRKSAMRGDDFAELYEAQRLEFRIYHSNSVYSRTKVVALTPAAVGETGDLILDEVGRVKNFREVWEAVKPIISSQPNFRCMLTTTPPPDDTHYSFELLAPPLATEFPVKAEGNWYRSDLGVWVLRVSAWDAYADGVPLYDDDTGAPIDPDTARRKDHDKDAWDRNYGVKFVLGGTAACGLLQLDTAQRRGIGQCGFVMVEEEADLDRAIEFMVSKLGPGAIGLGWDLATTEKDTSNPSAFCVMEQSGMEYIARLVVAWKTTDPDIALERARKLVLAVKRREKGGRARRLCVDATNEKYFATTARKELASEIPVELVVASETVERPGNEPITMKALMGGDLVGALDDNHLTLPPERYIKEDFRLVKKDRGSFATETGTGGQHGDTFDAVKQALRALRTGGPVVFQAVGNPRGERGTRIKGALI